nr:1926_t:CDS:2 [Entrophospora candida]
MSLSLLAASSIPALVLTHGHRIEEVQEAPLVTGGHLGRFIIWPQSAFG